MVVLGRLHPEASARKERAPLRQDEDVAVDPFVLDEGSVFEELVRDALQVKDRTLLHLMVCDQSSAAGPFRGDESGSRAQEEIQDDVSRMAGVLYRPLDQGQRLHGGVERGNPTALDLPDVGLIPAARELMLGFFAPAIPDAFTLDVYLDWIPALA